MSRRFALLLVLLVGCRGEEVTVLERADAGAVPPINSCDVALAEGRNGDACVEFPPCLRERGCCVDEAFCESGTLFLFENNCEACFTCESDEMCPLGEWCVGERCVPCEPIPEPPSCEPPFEPFERHGCLTAECLPPSQCNRDEECGPPGLRCAQGAACVCPHQECCANLCVEPECVTPEPAPEGCVRPCTMDPSCPTGMCLQLGCRCEADFWICEETCTPEPGPSC